MVKEGDLIFNGEEVYKYIGEDDTVVRVEKLDGSQRAYGKHAYAWKLVPVEYTALVLEAVEEKNDAEKKLNDIFRDLKPI